MSARRCGTSRLNPNAIRTTLQANVTAPANNDTPAKGSADLLALPARGRTPRHFQRRKSLKMKEPGNRVFRLRLIFGQDAQ
jgi:hypothetical protein